ncbi:hypothetical protein [Leeuwenhoekiella nanhaiensis]|uniref:Uncharacterized protein n=1 Tax=Leeuwenhoekiella nanhaiensis TaxID=1655491 RepID=A0A2G1VM80_9FLAO|nr:hypothetical protein [Leeuwenhoekiella nanhaiensis]PHQ27863.1 hypothetical protein CJ305_17820 [Leeuwenhoekiella nanhaiensis]
MKKWNALALRQLEAKGIKTDLDQQPKRTNVQKISHEKRSIELVLWAMKREGSIPDYLRELQFSDDRKFRFDWAIPALKIAIEYEGIFSEKSGHTTISGYTKDCIKYNLATLEGWKVLRYTAKNYEMLGTDLKILIKK